MGATWPGRWQAAQCSKKIGATSALYVTGSAAPMLAQRVEPAKIRMYREKGSFDLRDVCVRCESFFFI